MSKKRHRITNNATTAIQTDQLNSSAQKNVDTPSNASNEATSFKRNKKANKAQINEPSNSSETTYSRHQKNRINTSQNTATSASQSDMEQRINDLENRISKLQTQQPATGRIRRR